MATQHLCRESFAHLGESAKEDTGLALRRLVVWRAQDSRQVGDRADEVGRAQRPGQLVEDVGPERPEDISKGFAQRAQREMNGWASEDDLLASLRQGRTRVPEEMHRNWIRYETKRLESGRVVWKYDPAVTKGFVPTELWDYVSRIKAPTIYLLGAESNIVPPATQKRLEALLPHMLSAEGPAAVTGDMNGDGREDIFLGMLNGRRHKYTCKRQPVNL